MQDFGCRECIRYKKIQEGDITPFFEFINLSLYPSPCQSRCVYCSVQSFRKTRKVERGYEKCFGLIREMRKKGYISQDAFYQVSSGEITIHPYKNEILNLVQGKRAGFYTNCFIFDMKIAEHLSNNMGSFINLSIDAGTSETWNRVKGRNNYAQVLRVLKQYSECSLSPEQITLKYIVLPGLNDNTEDYLGCVRLLKKLGICRLRISRDTSKIYHYEEGYHDRLLSSTKNLVKVCFDNGIETAVTEFGIEEKEYIIG